MAEIDRLKRQLGISIDNNSEDDLLFDLLEVAKSAILSRRYPYDDFSSELENRYKDLQIRIAVYLYNKMGAEGELSHSENGISRTYEAGDIPESMLKQVVPLVGIPH